MCHTITANTDKNLFVHASVSHHHCKHVSCLDCSTGSDHNASLHYRYSYSHSLVLHIVNCWSFFIIKLPKFSHVIFLVVCSAESGYLSEFDHKQIKLCDLKKAMSHSHYAQFAHIPRMKFGHTWIYVEKLRKVGVFTWNSERCITNKAC